MFGPGWLYGQSVWTSPDWIEQSRLIAQKATQPKLCEKHGRVEWIRALHRHGVFIPTCLQMQGDSHGISWDSKLQFECDIEDNINKQKCCHLYNRWLICEWRVREQQVTLIRKLPKSKKPDEMSHELMHIWCIIYDHLI